LIAGGKTRGDRSGGLAAAAKGGAYDLPRPGRRMLIRVLAILCFLFATAIGARAVEGGTAPYDRDLQRLAEILGSLQYLRGVCGANEGQKWRNEMQALLEAEAPNGERRDRLIASFNRGYRGFQQTYRNCTPSADVAIRRYLDEGAKIAREITARYAN
jgi:uncharacterized protein (TIGR02301 family)